jgi:hypothetical protein
VKVLVTKGTISRKHGKHGEDIGFTILFPGEYAGSLDTAGELEINISDGKYAYLTLNKVQEKLECGDLVVLSA